MVATELAPTQMKKKRLFGEINDKAGGQQKLPFVHPHSFE